MEKRKKQNLALALSLSFLIALLGGAAWGLIYAMGWFVSVVAFVTAFGMFAVYMKLYNKLNGVPVIWTLFWVIVANIIGTFLAIVVSVSIQADVSFAVALEATIKTIPDYIADLSFDLILGVVFSVLGVVTCYKSYKKQQNKVGQQPIPYTTLEELKKNNAEIIATKEEKES